MAAKAVGSAIPVVPLLAITLGCASSPTLRPLPAPGEGQCDIETGYETDSVVLDALQAHFRPVLDANRLEFAGRGGRVEGFGAGAEYPQVWLRDGATLIPAIRYQYPRERLESWIEEHLSHQGPEGELWDWIAPGEPGRFRDSAPQARLIYSAGSAVVSADRNTTAADQEASAVDAAFGVFELTGDRGWLAKPLAGTPLLDRLDAALVYVLENRVDEGSGLVTSAFTADWGDVSPAHPDQRAIYLDDETPVVVGLYTNAFVSKAAEELAFLHGAAGNDRRMQDWLAVAGSLRSEVDRRFWQEGPGFYRIHDVVQQRGAPFDDSGIFAMGGNAVAVLSGVPDARRSARIFAAAEERRRSHGLSSLAGTLLPPYPAGVFPHPLLREPFNYQNGGQWDWWSGRLLLAMFRNGHSEAAYEQLVAVAERVSRAGGLFEWYTRDDQGRGSDGYAGNVGALSAALYQGLFGLDSRAEGLDVTVRLGAVSGSVRTCEPATGRRVAYRYVVEPDADRIRLAFEANAPGEGRLAVRLPRLLVPATVLLDGVPVRYHLEAVGDERYLVVSTSWSAHVLELQVSRGASDP